MVQQTFGVDTFQLTPSLVDPEPQSSRLDPAARRHDRQADLGPGLPDLLAQPVVLDARSDHPARIRSDRSVLVDPVAQRGPDLRARRARETHVLMPARLRLGRAARGVAWAAAAWPWPAALLAQDGPAPVIAEVRVEREGRVVTDPFDPEPDRDTLGEPLSMRDVRETIAHLISLNRSRTSASCGAGARRRLAALRAGAGAPGRPREFRGTLGVAEGDLRRLVVDQLRRRRRARRRPAAPPTR